jgi:hypothetical protein
MSDNFAAPWKEDDAAWFAANPRRTHRLREAYPGELEAMCSLRDGSRNNLTREDFPHVYVVVRQIQSGLRVRRPSIWLHLAKPLPQTDEFAHALFDYLASPHRVLASGEAPGGTFVQADIERLAENYKPNSRQV